MKNENPDFKTIYRRLGTRPEDGWEAIQRAYRRRIQVCHPDKWAGNPRFESIARKRFENINEGFRTLQRFHQIFGTPPPLTAEWSVGNDGAPASDASGPRSRTQVSHNSRQISAGLLLAVLAVAGGTWAWMQGSGSTLNAGSWTGTTAVNPSPMITLPEGEALQIGSSVGELIELLGRPDRIEQGWWFYRDAAVRVEDGRVSTWRQGTEFTLPLLPQPVADRILAAPLGSAEGGFGIGATKSEVAALQGEPILATETMWDYGVSKVYFENGRVSGWLDSPLDPLKVDATIDHP